MSIMDLLLGKPLPTAEEEGQKIGVLSGVAILGLDGLSSAGYGPEALMSVLMPLGVAGYVYFTPLTLIILGLLFILYFSYRQTIPAYPSGGGSYTVAKENLGQKAGLLAAAALMLDYILNVSVGISAGIGALVSAVPSLHPQILPLCLVTLVLITLVNMRGLRESGLVFALPTYMFLFCLGGVTLVGIIKALSNGGHPQPLEVPPAAPLATATTVSLWLLMRAFASGCTAMTGVEAVSNAVNAFEKPAVKKAEATLTVIVVALAALLAGIAYVSQAYGIGAMDGDAANYQSVISQLTAAVVGRGLVYYVTMASVLAVLALSANTSFAGFPRLCRLLAVDDYMPHSLASLGRRLVLSLGIISLAGMAGILLIIFGGITDRLIPLFAIGAFLAFTLSQAGMVMHWKRLGKVFPMLVNATGCVATAIALVVILIAKFTEGAWITMLLMPAMLWGFTWVRRHYAHVKEATTLQRHMDLTNLCPPLVVVPISHWSKVTERALRYALATSKEVQVVHIGYDEQARAQLQEQWQTYVEDSQAENLPLAQLIVIDSPYRLLLRPLLDYINELKNAYADRMIAVVIPELVEPHWYEYLLHSQRALALKAALLYYGDNRIMVVNVPWYLKED